MLPPPVPDSPEAPSNRPVAITIICVLGFLGALITIPLIFSDAAKNIGGWYPPYLALSGVVGFACMVGLWQMRRWAALTYTGLCLVNQVVLLSMGTWNVFALILPGIVVAIALSYLPRMR